MSTTSNDSPAFGVETIGMSKHFGSFTALDNVSMKVHPGSFHALLGENGAGKSTLVKCMIGYYKPDEGSVIVAEHEQKITNPKDAHALGIGMVYQHFTLVPSMTVAENLVMSRAEVPAVINWKHELEELRDFMAKMPFQVDLKTQVADLAAGEKQKVEILKQLYLQRRFLILDEPTSVLTPAEADEMLGLLRGMCQQGQLTILMITHKFREVMAFTDQVSVLRRGVLAGGGAVSELTPNDLAEMMIGSKDIPQTHSTKIETNGGNVRLEIEHLKVVDDRGIDAVDDLDLSVKAGEIVGIAGVSGNGQRELVEALAGQRKALSGSIRIHGKPYFAERGEMTEHKVFGLPEEPLRNACVARMSVAENIAFRVFDRDPYAHGWWLNKRSINRLAADLIGQYRVKTSSPAAEIGTLSGGNVQRAVLARELSNEVDVLIVANPVFGLDFAAVAEIHERILNARNQGAAVLLISEDLDEILELADRILVMFDGRLVYQSVIADADIAAIGKHMAGH